jgi:1-pyrroline-5-carboxylate dehydrogenase
MSTGFFKVPEPANERVINYSPGTKERATLKAEIDKLRSQVLDIPMIINGQEVRTDNKVPIHPPHERKHLLGHFHKGDATHVQMAIKAAMDAKEKWAALSWEHRASIFLKAAELIAHPYGDTINAATMLGQSKNVMQAEIDSACEMADFLRFNVKYMTEIYEQQPYSPEGIWNRVEQRPLEGFVFALTPFNFTSIAGNLPTAPAMMGNTVVWKCSNTQVYSAKVLMDAFMEAGVPPGVINLVFVSGPVAGNEIFTHPDFAGIHFTGSTEVFQHIWKTIGENIQNYKSYPRIVGETGGKDFIFAHPSSEIESLVVAMVRGAFEYQGQKCSAASRAYIPESIWPDVWELMEGMIRGIKMGPPEDFNNFFNAVIDEAAFDKLAGFIDRAKADKEAEVIVGGGYDKSVGFFIEPTVIKVTDPKYVTMREELFGPILTLYVYPDDQIPETLEILNETSIYALTGAIFAQDRYAIEYLTKALTHAAGNFYINDKPTGAVVGQQPFGGARGSGTNDKAGSMINLLRWVSPRTIKENFTPPKDYRYEFMREDKK